MKALLVINVQKGFLTKDINTRNNINCEENIIKLIEKMEMK